MNTNKTGNIPSSKIPISSTFSNVYILASYRNVSWIGIKIYWNSKATNNFLDLLYHFNLQIFKPAISCRQRKIRNIKIMHRLYYSLKYHILNKTTFALLMWILYSNSIHKTCREISLNYRNQQKALQVDKNLCISVLRSFVPIKKWFSSPTVTFPDFHLTYQKSSEFISSFKYVNL